METQTGASIGSSEAWFQHLAGQKPGQKQPVLAHMRWMPSLLLLSAPPRGAALLQSPRYFEMFRRWVVGKERPPRPRHDRGILRGQDETLRPIRKPQGPWSLLVWERTRSAAAGVCHQLPWWETSCVVASTTDDYPGAAWGPNGGVGGDPLGHHPSWLLFYITVLEFQCDSDDFQKKMINNWGHLSPVSLPGPLSARHPLQLRSALYVVYIYWLFLWPAAAPGTRGAVSLAITHRTHELPLDQSHEPQN